MFWLGLLGYFALCFIIPTTGIFGSHGLALELGGLFVGWMVLVVYVALTAKNRYYRVRLTRLGLTVDKSETPAWRGSARIPYGPGGDGMGPPPFSQGP